MLGTGYPLSMAEQAGIIGKGLKVKGEITGSGSLEVEGEVDGRVALDQLTVAPGGVVTAEVSVHEIVVFGHCAGQVSASKRVEIKASAHVVGDITSPALVLEEGAVFKGRVHMDTGIPEDV